MFDQTPDIEETRWSAVRGIRFGVASGLIFGVAATVGAVLVGFDAFLPFRLAASLLLGEAALTEASTGTVILWGLVVHFAVSIYWGLVFGLSHEWFIHSHRMRNPSRIVLGILFGLGVWALNFLLIARLFYPWFLESR